MIHTKYVWWCVANTVVPEFVIHYFQDYAKLKKSKNLKNPESLFSWFACTGLFFDFLDKRNILIWELSVDRKCPSILGLKYCRFTRMFPTLLSSPIPDNGSITVTRTNQIITWFQKSSPALKLAELLISMFIANMATNSNKLPYNFK